ncbi:hypothetical protein K402DRAFT_403263 [Aulographum hederae CBS 113979]|uniref:Cora-domain-containing protein n=1 Tax=Aulographum hederae CBS 113979 TaxID=1176131 RepID=A0A6G1H4V8_9PEZI|nr:hypothetical protein K402DRAFT_403263 [Aulographum hederae CBS 113979]
MPSRSTIKELAGKKKKYQTEEEGDEEKAPNHEVTEKSAIPDTTIENQFAGGTLKVIDAPFSGSRPVQLLQLGAVDNHGVEEALIRLPEHQYGVARIFDFTLGRHYYRTGVRYMIDCKDRDLLRRHLLPYITSTYKTPPIDKFSRYSWENGTTPATDISLLFRQWSQDVHNTQQWFSVSTATSLGQNTDCTKLVVEDSFITCLRDGDDRLIVLSINVLGVKREFLPHDTLYRHPRLTDAIAKSTAWITLSSGNLEHFTRLLLVDFFCSGLYLQDVSFFSPLLQAHNTLIAMSPQIQTLFSFSQRDWKAHPSPEAIDLVSDLQSCEQVLQDVQDISDSVNILFQVLAFDQDPSGVNDETYLYRCCRLKEICNQRLTNSKRRLDRLHRAFESQNKMANIKDSNSIKLLSILACIFLPLSLSSSLLSMQTRFVNLHLMLYDFVGVFVIISSATILMYFIVRTLLYLKSKLKRSAWSPLTLWQKQKRDESLKQRKIFRRTVAVILLCFYISVWVLILLSFILGMAVNVVFGLKIFLYGFGGIVGFLIVLIPGLKWFANRMYKLEALTKDN